MKQSSVDTSDDSTFFRVLSLVRRLFRLSRISSHGITSFLLPRSRWRLSADNRHAYAHAYTRFPDAIRDYANERGRYAFHGGIKEEDKEKWRSKGIEMLAERDT